MSDIVKRLLLIKSEIKDLFVNNKIIKSEPNIIAVCKTFSMESKNQEKNLIESVKQNCRKIVKDKTGKKPFTNINIARL